MDVKWIDFFRELGINTGGSVLLLIVIGFFGKQLITYFFSENIELKKMELNKDLEKHKQGLLSQTEQYKLSLNMALESHRSELTLLNTKYSRIHEKQLTIMAELYKYIVEVDQTFRAMTATVKEIYENAEKEEQERVQAAIQAYNTYLIYLSHNKIFFSEKIVALLDSLRDKYLDSYHDYTFPKRFGIDDVDTKIEHFKSALNTVREQIPEVLKQLEIEFRELLSVK